MKVVQNVSGEDAIVGNAGKSKCHLDKISPNLFLLFTALKVFFILGHKYLFLNRLASLLGRLHLIPSKYKMTNTAKELYLVDSLCPCIENRHCGLD